MKALFHLDAEVPSRMAAGKTVWGVGSGEGFRPEALNKAGGGGGRPGLRGLVQGGLRVRGAVWVRQPSGEGGNVPMKPSS